MSRVIFEPIQVLPKDLWLDPNNPRLIADFAVQEPIDDLQIGEKQNELEARFSESGSTGDEFTDIKDLYDSMLRVGYVGIDRIVVREIEGRNAYLVLEGNRRTSSIKRLLKKAQSFEGSNLQKFDKVKHTFDKIDVLLLKTRGLDDAQVRERVSVILGLRHFGSVLDWEPINRAFNAYQSYMGVKPRLDEFREDNDRIVEVANQLAVSTSKIKSSLKTYVAYRQLTKINSNVDEDHYSLISAAIPLASKYKYFDQDTETYKFSEESLSRVQDLCQFDKRKGLRGSPEKLILPDPKAFNRMGKLLKQKKKHENETIRNRAKDLIELIEAGDTDEDGNLEMTIDRANSLLTKEINRKEWVSSVRELLQTQESDLPFEKYDGEGNHLQAKENLQEAIVHLRRLFDV